jgi:hypothetical protein
LNAAGRVDPQAGAGGIDGMDAQPEFPPDSNRSVLPEPDNKKQEPDFRPTLFGDEVYTPSPKR